MRGSKRWPVTAWRELLTLALGVIDEADPTMAWTFGGGTALALRLNHRISYDVDLFVDRASALRALSPNRNQAARAVTERWQEPGNYLKLERDEGCIDFIVAACLTDLPPWRHDFMEREVWVEHPAEIVAKKLKYRGSRLLMRDVFDLLAVQRFDPALVDLAIDATPDGARRAADRIQRMAPRYREQVRDEVNPTASGVDLLDADPLQVARCLGRG